MAHKTLTTFPTGTVRFSFSHYNTEDELTRRLPRYMLFVNRRDCDVWIGCTGIIAYFSHCLSCFWARKAATIGHALGKSLHEFKDAVNADEAQKTVEETAQTTEALPRQNAQASDKV